MIGLSTLLQIPPSFCRLRAHRKSDSLFTAAQFLRQLRVRSQFVYSPCGIIERQVNKIAMLEQKKQHYEEILRRELDMDF